MQSSSWKPLKLANALRQVRLLTCSAVICWHISTNPAVHESLVRPAVSYWPFSGNRPTQGCPAALLSTWLMEWSVGPCSSSVTWRCTRASRATSWKALAGVCAWRMAHGLHPLPAEVAQGFAHVSLPLKGLSFYKHLWFFLSLYTTIILHISVLSSYTRSSSKPPAVVDGLAKGSTCMHAFIHHCTTFIHITLLHPVR